MHAIAVAIRTLDRAEKIILRAIKGGPIFSSYTAAAAEAKPDADK